MADKAGKAAPAMAIAGALVASPQAHAAVTTPAKAATVAEHVHKAAAAGQVRAEALTHTDALVYTTALVKSAQPASRTYTVRPGDTLSSIAQRFYGNAADWPWLYHVNEAVVQDPNQIYVGEKLSVPYDPPANATSYAPKHAAATTLTSSATLSGTLGCSGLEALWEQAGGLPGEAFMAAEIAMAESGGHQYALSPTDDYGYWQINASHGALATFNAYGNARAAVIISDDGTDWDPWTTYVTGAYEGRC